MAKKVSDNMPTEKRIEWIDLAKGVCLLPMIAGHCGLYSLTLYYLYLPLFFFVSGMFYKDYGSLLNLSIKKVNALIIPFVFFYMFYELTSYIIDYQIEIGGDKTVFDFHILKGMADMYFGNQPLWFLPCLFWCYMIYYLISKVTNVFEQTIYVAVLAKLGMIFWNSDFFLPFHFSTALLAMPFFFLGNITRNRFSYFLQPNRFDKYNVPMALVGISIVVLLSNYVACGKISFWNNKLFDYYLLFYPYALIMIASTLLLCKTIKRIPVVSFCGRHTLIILGTHVFFIRYMPKFFPVLEDRQWIIFFLSLFMSIVCVFVLRKLCPHLTGEKEIFHIVTRSSIN